MSRNINDADLLGIFSLSCSDAGKNKQQEEKPNSFWTAKRSNESLILKFQSILEEIIEIEYREKS